MPTGPPDGIPTDSSVGEWLIRSTYHQLASRPSGFMTHVSRFKNDARDDLSVGTCPKDLSPSFSSFSERSFHSQLHKMTITSFFTWILPKFDEIRPDAPSWYSIISACIFLMWLLLRGLYHAMTCGWRSTSFFILKHFMYPHLLPRMSFIGTATRFQIIVTALYITTNVLLVAIGVTRADVGTRAGTIADVGTRAGTMSVINLIPLLCGPRLSMMTEMLGISLRSSLGSHRWIGRTAIAQALLHLVIYLTGNQFGWTSTSISGVVVVSHLSGS